MVTFKQFISEQDQPLDQLADMIKRDCQPWLAEAGSNLIFRGMDEDYLEDSIWSKPIDEDVWRNNAFKCKVRKDRRPKDSSDTAHKALDDLLLQKTGIPFRSAGLFCAKSSRIAGSYGHVYAVFPIGKFDYAWSPYIYDAFESLGQGNMSTDLMSAIGKVWPQVIEKFENATLYKTFADTYHHLPISFLRKEVFYALSLIPHLYEFNVGLRTAPPTSEIMIATNYYYAISADLAQKLKPLL